MHRLKQQFLLAVEKKEMKMMQGKESKGGSGLSLLGLAQELFSHPQEGNRDALSLLYAHPYMHSQTQRTFHPVLCLQEKV
ncbi:hypothetical protein M8C21_019732 [Ambrosia artemisiifolia]|uniref:Uncharacterized protein n=1 Tax=Ambrosia artemisiifolia TaxID=4212 RepID=A0AAD5D729_AMBAR|nr:hypothetical protein M8C21_019732 [Ambrosia artemisiifolia]